jgi:DnaJ-class molecular chaperone
MKKEFKEMKNIKNIKSCKTVGYTELTTVPYQVCPLCLGRGYTEPIGMTSSSLDICTVCNGDKIIPQHIVNYNIELKDSEV